MATVSATIFALVVIATIVNVEGIFLQGSRRSYAKYAKWNGCKNATISFEFKSSQNTARLMYVDDGGDYDFMDVSFGAGRVRLEMNIVDGKDGSIQLESGRNVNDGRWHKVEIIRNRMETKLIVDGQQDSDYSFGSDFNFGSLAKNSYVYFGGLPESYDLGELSSPDALYTADRLRGYIRNVIYQNCSCVPVRVALLDGVDIDQYPPESCDRSDPCQRNCVCVSEENGHKCDCARDCGGSDAIVHYSLPFDAMDGSTVINPSGLDATAFGNPALVPGVLNSAIRLETPRQYVRVTGPGHRYECFGDLTKCARGHTLSFWVNFENPVEGEVVYLSNGGHTDQSHGVAMMYDNGQLEFRYRRKNGDEWSTKTEGVTAGKCTGHRVPVAGCGGRWYHIATSWSFLDGLSLYINGEHKDRDISPSNRSPESVTEDYSNFFIGKRNDDTSSKPPAFSNKTILVDEFNFWSTYMTADQIRELGPFAHFYLPMDLKRGNKFIDTKWNNRIHGRPNLLPARINDGMKCDGGDDYVDLMNQRNTCMGDISKCQHGIYTGMWAKFDEVHDGMYLLDSGNKGFRWYIQNGKLYCEYQRGNQNWRASYGDVKADKWYYLESSWKADDGVRLWRNLQQVAHQGQSTYKQPAEGSSNMYMGRANTNMIRERHFQGTADELEVWYADRQTLIDMGYIQRGRPFMYYFDMERIVGNQLINPQISVMVNGQRRTQTVEGQVGNALRLDGRWSQYAQLGQHNDTCLGNLNQCRHGALLAGWVRLSDIRDGSHIFYTGQNGFKVRYNNGRIESSASTDDKMWSVTHGGLTRDQWHYVEYAWHPRRGYKVYVDQELVGEDHNPLDRAQAVYNSETNGVYFGRGGDSREGTADASMDEMEYWYSNREYLVAFDFLQRGKPEHLLIDMDRVNNGRVVHPYITARVFGNAQTTTGRINNAVRFDGRSQYIDIGDQSDSCLGDMKKCRHGYTGSMYLNARDFRDNDYYLSTGNGMNIYYRNGRMNFVVYDPENQRRWLVEVPGLRRGQWYNLQYTWHKDRGLRVYVDNKLAGRSDGEAFYNFPRGRSDVLIGRANQNAVPYGRNNYANVDVDNFEVWYLDRDDLISRGIIQTPDDIEHFYIPLEVQMGNVVAHPRLRILLFDGASIVPAYIKNGATMDGTRQFVSLGDHKNCMGDLDQCKNGITYTFHVNARKLDDYTYLMSAGPYSVYTRNGRIYADMATKDEKWTVSGPGIQTNKWYRVDVTWSKEKGLEMYVNDRLSGRDTSSRRTTTDIADYNVYLGRPNGRTRGRHLDGRIDEVEFWFAHRDQLIDLGIWNPVVPTEPPTTTPAPTTTTRAPITTPRPVITTEAAPTLVFDGNNWVLYDWSQLPEDYFRKNDREEITLTFRSRDPNGLIWLGGTREENMHVSLKNGALLVVADYGDNNSDKYRVRPPSGRLDDNKWHTAVLRRDGRRLKITIDGRSYDQILTQEPMIIGRGAMTLGGSDDVRDLTDSHVRARLNGEVREATISGNNLRSDVDLTDLFFRAPRPGYVIINGPFPHFGPKETSIHIKDPSSFVKLPSLDWEPRQGGQIEFKFRTAQQHGLLLYNGGRPGLRDFIAVEMHDGKLYFNVDMGPGVNRYKFSDVPVNDGKPHEVKIEKSGNIFRLTLDGIATQHVAPGSDQSLSLGSDLYLGGASKQVAPHLPWHLWTHVPRSYTAAPKFYVGCLWDFKLNSGNLFLDLPKMVREQRMPGIDAGCVAPDMQCELNPCAHGVCRSTADSFICDCSDTPYTGDRCEKRAPIVTFDGTDFLRINLQPMMVTHTNDVSVRFKTHKPNGLLFVTSNTQNGGKMVVDLKGGRARVHSNLGGEDKEVFAGNDLNDERWHTLYVRRRADHLEVWVDDQPHQIVDLPGEGWTLDIDEIRLAADGKDAPVDETYLGYMQNFFFNNHRYFEMVDPDEVGPGVIISDREHPIPIFKVTFVSPTDSYLTLPTLVVADGFEVSFLVKTKEKDGLLLYNDGLGNEFLALELIGGYVQLVFDDGTGPKLLRGIPYVSDNNWHKVTLRRPPGENFELVVDDISTKLPPNVRKDRMQLRGDLFVGGMPRNRYDDLPEQIMSNHGYRGCMASMRIQRKLVDMMSDALTKTEYLKQGCTTVTAFCKPNTCMNDGICREGWNTFICDCNMTSFVGRICTEEAEGYHYEDYGRGIVMYNFPTPHPSTSQDELAFAFMSWFADGNLVRVDSDDSNDYIDISLVDGNVVATYDIGEGTFRMVESRRNFSDGQYHIVRFVRKGHDATLRVDDFPRHRNNPQGTSVRIFNGQSVVKVGGNRAVNGTFYDSFNGILAGVYFNGVRVIDRGIVNDGNIYQGGDYYIAKHPFYLPPPQPRTPPPTQQVITDKPIVIPPSDKPVGPITPIPTQTPPVIPPGVEVPHNVPYGQGGGGIAYQEFGPQGEGIFVAVDPGGAGGGLPAPGGGVALPVVGGQGVAAGGVEGGRAIAATGAMLGILLFGSSLVWAFYKLKPGVMALGGGGGGGKGMSISRPTANYQLVSNGPPFASVVKAEANGGVAVEAYSDNANASTQTSAEMAALANYFSSSAITASSISNTAMVAPGFIMRAAQTDMAAGGFAGAPAPPAPVVAAVKASSETQTTDLVDLNAAANALVQHQQHQQQQQQNYNEAYSQQFNSYQMSQQSYQQNQTQSQTGYSQNLMAAEEIRVDCALMTGDSRYVITGSINGPPQVWDMKSGNLVRIMGGENLSSTDVHLACNDTLMVGQVAEMNQVDPTDTLGNAKVQNRKLQLWDIASGQPLDMAQTEMCTASCMMKDGERIVLGRTEKFGGGTTVVIWDLLANEAVRKIHYDGAVGFADHISYISLSQDNRYVIAGFQNSYDGNANFIIFDLTVNDYSRVEPKIIALDAQAECTAVLPNHEAVTGTRQGELVIWSMRTGKPLRQLVATGNKAMSLSRGGNMSLACAHTAEVKGVAVSNDDKLLVSASADCTIKVWNLETEKVIHTLRGHTDQVLSCTVSADSEIVVSGSKDGTIRLWKAFDGSPITQFYTGIDIFKVIMSKNKHYIVGLGDKEGARKLVMLQVVRTKTRSRAPSRATSPYGTSSRPTSPYNRSTSPYGTSPHHRPISPYR